MKKTNRKNKTNLVVNWPTGWFTVDSLLSDNAEFEKITLRVRINKALEDKSVSVIGTLKGSKGRPKLVFATTPASQDILVDAKSHGVVLDNDTTNMVEVVNVSAPVAESEEVHTEQVEVTNTNTDTVNA